MGSTPGKGPEMFAAWVNESSPEHPPQVAMNFQSEETFFNFDMFNEDLSEDLNFLFSETPEIPEIPAPSNDATDPMATTSQLPANHFDSNMKSSAVLKSTNIAKLPNSSLDMNDPTVLGFCTQLFMFQQESKRQEFVFCSPDYFIQDILHSLARMLGLEYEHSLRPSQVRISRPSHTPYLEPGRLGNTQSQDTFYPTSAPERTGMQIAQSISSIPGNFEATEVHPNENVSMGLDLIDLLGKAPTNLVSVSKWNSYYTEEKTLNLPLTNGILCSDFSSMAGKIPTAVPFPNQSFLEVNSKGQMTSGENTPEFPTESWSSSIEHDVPRSASGGSTTAVPVSTDIQFIFEPTPTSGKLNYRGKPGPLNSSALTESRAVKAQGGACWKCRILRKKCNPHEPCHECQKGDAGSVWRAIGCRRGPLGCKTRRIQICPRYKGYTIQETHLFGDSSAGLNQFPIDSLHACLSTVLHHLQEKDSLCPSFQISCAPSSLLDVPALSIFVVRTYATSRYGNLIYNTFRCLRSCLSALEPIASDSVVTQAHQNCQATKCHCENSQAIEIGIGDYLDELSRILFSKKTLRGDKSWWLPVFCSLCIQGFVKKLLMALLKEQDAVGIISGAGGKYLQEAVQLFTALSSCFDPLMNQDGAQLDVGSVKSAIFHRRWPSNSIQNSFQYLEYIFYTQESPTTDLLKTFTNESPIANLRPRVMSPRFVGHSRMTMESDGTEDQEKLPFNHGSIDGALCNVPGKKRNEEITLIIETPYEDPEDPKLTECQMPLDYILQPQGKSSHLEIVSNAPITTNPTQKPKIDTRKLANNTKEEISRGNIASLVEAQPKPSQPVSSPPMFFQPQDYPPPISSICSELDPELELDLYGSLTSSYFTCKFENGRSYHSYQSGKYYLPNDEQEQDRLDMQYHMIFEILLEGRKFLSPIKNPKRILDQCTGTEMWAINRADEFSEAEVLGTDLSPIQPSLSIPRNLNFLVDDVDQDWIFHHATYDFIHCSFGHGYSSQNWGFFLSESYRCLAPGGWVEIKDFDITALSPDDSLPGTNAISKWHDKFLEGASLGDINIRASYSNLEQIFQNSGFINVKFEVIAIPCGSWSKDKKLKEVGTWQKHCFRGGLEAYSLAIFTRLLGWSLLEVEALLAEVRSELGNSAYHWYWPFFVIYGQKPEN